MSQPCPSEGAEFSDAAIPQAWAELRFFTQSWPAISAALVGEGREILPPSSQIFAALEAVAPDAVRVAIIGQDPYPSPGHADGLAFSVAPDIALPRSLANVFAEMQADLGCRPDTGHLGAWAEQGVLLLNACLTVPAREAGGHRGLGWQRLAAEVLELISERPTAFILWGRHAQALKRHIRPGAHLFVESAHPSPLSARNGFFGSKPFSRVNEWLAQRGEAPIDWCRSGSNERLGGIGRKR